MEKNKILIGPATFCAYDDSPLKVLKQNGFDIVENPRKQKLTRVELLTLLKDDVVGLISGLEPLSREILEHSSLKVISRSGSGMNNVDLKAAKELGIVVRNTPDGPVSAVAELTVGSILSMLRHIALFNKEVHSNIWKKQIGYQLEGKTVAIIGFGYIGKKVASLLKMFNVKVVAVDQHDINLCDENSWIEKRSLKEALAIADIVSIHVSGDEKLISEKEFSVMKDGVFIANPSRGGVVDEKALCDALDSEKVKGVWMDVYSEEPYSGPLAGYEQVLMTPHIGSFTYECRKKMEMEAVTNLISAFKERS